MSFYTNYIDQCNKKGLSPSAAAEAMGFKRSMVTRWSKGSAPRQATLQRMADYFSCSLGDLVNEKKEPATPEGSELDDALVRKLMLLTPDEVAKVDAFVQGLLASR